MMMLRTCDDENEEICLTENSVEEALIEMYLAGVSVRRVEDITEALWGDQGFSWHHQQLQQEGLWAYRDIAQPSASQRGISLRLH